MACIRAKSREKTNHGAEPDGLAGVFRGGLVPVGPHSARLPPALPLPMRIHQATAVVAEPGPGQRAWAGVAHLGQHRLTRLRQGLPAPTASARRGRRRRRLPLAVAHRVPSVGRASAPYREGGWGPSSVHDRSLQSRGSVHRSGPYREMFLAMLPLGASRRVGLRPQGQGAARPARIVSDGRPASRCRTHSPCGSVCGGAWLGWR